ncbi:PREDICTED: stAR-related lipid transfer protein 9 [Nanorana parkeri]|uniref:stAR-related lipid transfer protein 9 n=1 Tax=Nanorana parkeri TaxID=125878 RepID=UPI000854B608|nr:PREDICTED: stAR-related lipid transfer protein 9 [Nanorana parkeri]
MANVKVALRVRPLSKREIAEGARVILNVDDKIARIKNIKLDYRADGCGDTRERHMEFGFDYCYFSVDPDDPKYASQEVVFQDLGTTVLSEAITGYNVCLFAYGQTGSGKTYTMMGTPTSVGLTPRICEGLFCYNADSLGAPSSCRIEVSFLEIYNERVRDLLHQADQKKPYTLRVREHPEKGPYVQGLSQHVVTSYEEVVALLEEGMENRITAATHIHDASSRSHAIFTIQYTQAIFEDNLPSEITSKVNLVDLAERASPNYCKDRLTEGSNINRSLVTLGIVISALAQNSQMSSSCQSINSIISDGDSGIQGSSPSGSSISGSKRQPFVPYRDSILTWLLKDSLGGNSKTIMIATVSPASSSYNETMSTLRYASNAKNIINKPRVNEDTNVKLIRELREEINRLKAMLRNFEMRTTSPAFSEERDGNITELVRQNELKIEQLTKDWTDKWTDKAALMEQYNVDIDHGKARVTIDSGLPHLIAMDDDILSTGVVIYHLKEGTTNIGKGDHDIVLQAECTEQDHCVIENNFGVVELRPVSGALCTVNGQEVTDVCRLSQGAVIVLGKSHRFRFNHPAEAAVLRQMRSDSQASFVGDSSLDWLDLSGDYSSEENSLIFNTSSEIVSEDCQQRIKDLESSCQQQVEEQQRYVEDLKRQIRVAQVKGENELEQEQTLINQQIEENQQWLLKETQRLTAVCQQRKESAVQTEFKTYAEVEIQNCVQTEIQPSPEELNRKQLLQLELLRKCSLRRAERNIRRKRVKFQLDRIVKKQKLLEAKKTLQQLEAACWINEDALKPTYLHIPKLKEPVVRSTSPDRTRTSSSIFSYYRRRSLPWTLQTLPTYSALLKRKCKSELLQKSKTRENKKPLRALSIDCLKTSPTCGSCDEVDNESSILEVGTTQAENRTINLLISHRNSGVTFFPSDPQMSKKRQKMDKAGGRSRGLYGCPTEPPKKRNARAAINTGTKDTKLKETKKQSQPTAGIPRKNTVLEKIKPTAKSECVKSPPEKYAKNIQRSPGPGKIAPRDAFTVKGARGNMTTSMPNTKTKPVNVANKISSSVDNISKLNNHPEDRHVTDRRWMSTDRLNKGLLRSSIQRLEHGKEDESSDSSDGESFYSVDSLSSAYANALNEQLKQEEREKQKFGRRDSDSEDSQMSQDSLVERENKKDRPNKRKYNRYKTIVTHSGSPNSLTEYHNSFPLVTTGSVTTGFSKSFSLDSLADADEVPDVDSSEERPAEIFWKLQSPRCVNMNDDDQKNVDITTTGENTALQRSASFYLKMNEGATMGYRDTSTPLNVPDVKSQQIDPSPPVLNGEHTLLLSPSEKCTVEPVVNDLHQDVTGADGWAAKTDSDFTQDEGKEVSTKNNVIKSRPRACPDIKEELNAQYCVGTEPLHENLNMCNLEGDHPNTSYSKVKCLENKKPVYECNNIDNDCSSKHLGEFSTSKDHPNFPDVSHNFMEGEKNKQKSVPDMEKKDVALELIGYDKENANKMLQPLPDPSTDEKSNKDTTVSVKTSVNRDPKMSIETHSQYIKDTHKESVEPNEVNIKVSSEQTNITEELTVCDKNLSTSLNNLNIKPISTVLLENANQDMRQNTCVQFTTNEMVSDISRLNENEECKPREMVVLQENGEMHDHADVTMESFDQNVIQVGSTYVQTDYLNNQTAVLSDTCSEYNKSGLLLHNNLEIEKIQKNIAGFTNELQTDQQIHTVIATTNLASQVTSYTATIDLNGNRDCKLETQQSLCEKDTVCENKTADPLHRVNNGLGRIAADKIADVSTPVIMPNQPLSAAKNISHTMSIQQSDAINVTPLAIYNNLLQHVKNLGEDDSPASRTEDGSVDGRKDSEIDKQIKKINENDEKAFSDTDDGKLGALEGKPEDPPPANKHGMIKHDIFEKETDQDYGKDASKDTNDNHVTATQDFTTSGRDVDGNISFGSTTDRHRNLHGRFEEESEPIHNKGRESYQTKDQNFSAKAQEENLLVQETLDKLPSKNKIMQIIESPLAKDKLEEKTAVIFSQDHQNATCKSESIYPVLANSSNACTLPTAASPVNSSQCMEEPNEAQNDIENDTNKCQYPIAQIQEANKQTEMSLSCQPSSFRPCQETEPTEKANVDYGSGHISEASICTTYEFEHNLKSKLSLLMDKGTPQSTEMVDACGIHVISDHTIVQSDPSLQLGYRSKENEGIQNNICLTEADCGEYPSELNRSTGISSGEDDTETSSPLVSSGLTSLNIGSLETLSVLNECKSDMDGAIHTDVPGDFSHLAFSKINTSPCTMSNKAHCSTHTVSECVPPTGALAESHLTESQEFPPNGLPFRLRSESFPQTLVSSTKTMCNIEDHSNIESTDRSQHSVAGCKINSCFADPYQAPNCFVNAQENTVGHAHFKDDGTDNKSYIPNILPSNLHSSLFNDSSTQTQTSVEDMVENKEGLHFSSSDINPFVHSWQQEVSPRAGWRNCSFYSASDVSCSKFQATADKLIRCSSVNEGLNCHSSPFNSHLSSYANAKQASSTISSFGGNDSRHDLNSLDGFQAHLLDETDAIHRRNDMEFVGTSGSQVRFEDDSQLDEIMILYTSESETCTENDQRMSYEQRTHTKPRYRKTSKHQRSNTDVSSSRQVRQQKSFPWSNVQSMSLHLSQLLQETSELLGNLSQQRENVPFDAIGLQKDAAESVDKKSVKDAFTQTYEDKGIQTDKLNINSAQNYGTEMNSFLSPSEINVIVKVVGADSSVHIPHKSHLTGAQDSDQKTKVRRQSLPNLHDYVPSKPAEHESKSSHVRASAPFLNGSKDMSSRSLQISSPRSPPVSAIFKKFSREISPAVVNKPSSGVVQTMRCHTANQGNSMMVDRASSPILTLRASKKPFDKFGPENHSNVQNLEKVSQHRKRRERRNHDLQVATSQIETDSESIFSSDQGNRENEFEGGHCSSLRESPKRRIATHQVQRYKSEGCILQNKHSPFTNQFSSNSEISGYEDREDRKDYFRSIQPKKVPASTFAALPAWERPQSLENISQVAQPVLDRHRQLLTRTTRKDYGADENDIVSSTINSSYPCAKIENYPFSRSQVSGFDLQLQEDSLSVVESECNTDILLGQEPTLANSHKSHNYSLQDLPLHNKFSNWSGVQGSLPRNVQLLLSYPNLSMKRSPSNPSQEEVESRSREIERLQRERAEIMSAVHLEINPQPLTVQLAEAKLSYGIGETDALLRVIQTGKMDHQDQVSIKKQLYERHMKAIENLRKEREERLQSFRRSRSLSPQKQLSASQTSLSSLRDSDLPSRRREYLQQLRRDVVDSTRIQEPKRRAAQCPSEIEAMLKDYQKAREEARTEIARARDKLRERAEVEKRRLLQGTLQKEDTKMKTLVSTSTLFTNSSLSLSSGPTSGYNSGITNTPAKGNKINVHEAKTSPMGLDLELGSGRGRSAVRNSYLLVPTLNASASDPNINQPPPEKSSAAEVSPAHSGHPHGPLLQSTPVLYQDFATQVQASAMAEVMAACSYDIKNLFSGQAAAGWIYQTTEKDVLVYYKAFSSPTKHGFIGAGVIKRPLHNVWDMVKDVHARGLYDQSILSACVHQRVSSTVQLVHVVMDMSLCYLKQPRDFCCITVESKEAVLSILCFQSVYNESMPRPNKDAVRGEILPSAWILQPDSSNGETVTRVIYMVQADLGAPAIPSRLLGVVSKRQPLVISGLANFFSR